MTIIIIMINCLCLFTASASKIKSQLSHDEVPLEENLNKLEIEGDEARTVEEAISVLG